MLLALAFFTVKPGYGDETARAAAADPADLWQKALDIFQKNSNAYPEKITILSEVLDRHDQPDSVTQLFFALSMDAKDQLRTRTDARFKKRQGHQRPNEEKCGNPQSQ